MADAAAETISRPAPGAGARAAIPNLLTALRLVLAAAFIALLSLYDHPAGPAWTLPIGAVLFAVAASTDALDGWLARRWNVITPFGRVMDPFADKILVLGAFVVMAGPGFAAPGGGMVSGVAAWMAVVVLARELLVTSVRGVLEGAGLAFAASWPGKAKMFAQSVAVPVVLALAWLRGMETPPVDAAALRIMIDVIVWIVVVITVVSGAPYLVRAVALMKHPPRPHDQRPGNGA